MNGDEKNNNLDDELNGIKARSNPKEPDLIDSNISVSRLQLQEEENIKSDRRLKKDTHKFIEILLIIIVFFTFGLLCVNTYSIFKYSKPLYTEQFLTVLIGSQLVILPFSLFYIVTKNLFPNKDK